MSRCMICRLRRGDTIGGVCFWCSEELKKKKTKGPTVIVKHAIDLVRR